eukprot:679795-Alexandrium_andersonii.AAC.1
MTRERAPANRAVRGNAAAPGARRPKLVARAAMKRVAQFRILEIPWPRERGRPSARFCRKCKTRFSVAASHHAARLGAATSDAVRWNNDFAT